MPIRTDIGTSINNQRSGDEISQPRRPDSSPIGRFLLDKSRRSLRIIKTKADSLSSMADDGRGPEMSSASAGVRLLPRYSHASTSKNSSTFENISYLGCSRIKDPLSEPETLQIIASFNAEKSHDSVNVCLEIPPSSAGTVRLFQKTKDVESEISCFPIQRIRFCARGKPGSSEDGCFALSFTHQFTPNSAAPTPSISDSSVVATQCHANQCHVFRCRDADMAAKALMCFANAFRSEEPKEITSNAVDGEVNAQFEFEVFLEIKEEDFKTKTFSACPVEKNCVKLRRDREKRIVMVLRQTAGPTQLIVCKCFGVLLAAGRNLRESDMHLLDIENASQSQNHVFVVEAVWNPSAQNFEVLNTETPKETRVFMTVAIDVILSGIDEPVRFNVECKARVFQQFERFWYVPRKALIEQYFLALSKMNAKECSSAEADQVNQIAMADSFKVVRFESQTERERNLVKTADGNRSPTKMPTQLIHPADDDESDSDEPLLSGSGEVNRECSEDILQTWREVIRKWKEEPDKRPDELNGIIINDGIPDVLRGEVWQLLAKVYKDDDLVETYRMLFDQECPSEQVILRDIHRTFPAHDFFRESNGVGQEALYKLSKAYSLYDEEVGYCQGLSFLGAALLLHMPQEQAFCVLVKIMFDYNLRGLFKLGFDALHLRFYQLQRLIEDYEHELYAHFFAMHVETHMYASQWFLTLFTAKFPLQMVFFIVDLFLTEGINTIFHISLALLQDSKKELLQLDFEGILKYFRVALPRRYRTETNAKELIRSAVKLKISRNRLSRYEKDYLTMKQRELESLDPLERLERENMRLKETILRLERENDDLAHELVTSKIELRHKLDTTEDQLESALATVSRRTRAYDEIAEEVRHMREESEMVKTMCRQEVSRLDDELRRAQNVIGQYKKICTDLGETFDADRLAFEEHKRTVQARISGCDRCVEAVRDLIEENPRNRRLKSQNKSDAANNNEDGASIERLLNGNSIDAHGVDKRSLRSAGGSTLHIVDLMDRLEEREEHIRQVELELAQTKLALVESQCQNQDLTHQMSTSMSAAAAATDPDNRPAWIRKTISSLREVGTSLKSQPSVAASSHPTASFSVVSNSADISHAGNGSSGHHRQRSMGSVSNVSTSGVSASNASDK